MTDAGYDHTALRLAAMVTGPIVLTGAMRAAALVRANNEVRMLIDNDELAPVGYDGHGSPLYAHQVNAR